MGFRSNDANLLFEGHWIYIYFILLYLFIIVWLFYVLYVSCLVIRPMTHCLTHRLGIYGTIIWSHYCIRRQCRWALVRQVAGKCRREITYYMGDSCWYDESSSDFSHELHHILHQMECSRLSIKILYIRETKESIVSIIK